MPEPDVSVIVPARNEADRIGAALASVAAQDWPLDCLEVIVVVNASTDRTADRVTDAADGLSPLPIRLFCRDEPGSAAAKNVGAAAASGRILLFMDADSRMSPGLVRAVVHHLDGDERAASIRIASDDGDLLDRGFFGLLEFGKRLFGIRANMFACERALFARVGGFDETLRQAEDLEFLRRASRSGAHIGHVHEERILTSPRRLHAGRWHSGVLRVFGRWALGHFGIGRRWPY